MKHCYFRNYITLAEFCGIANPKSSSAKSGEYAFINILSSIDTGLSGTDGIEQLKVFREYIFPNYWNMAIAYVDKADESEPTNDELTEAKNQAVGYFYTWWLRSTAYYVPLIREYEAQKNNLMNKVQSTSTSKYNDTPQNNNDGFAEDNFVSNISSTVNETDGTTVMQRLDEIRKLQLDLYDRWSKDFSGLFVMEVE